MSAFSHKRTFRRRVKGTLNWDVCAALGELDPGGLRCTRWQRGNGKPAVLVYLYAEPEAWRNGAPVNHNAKKSHAQEAEPIVREVGGAEVARRTCTYQKLLTALWGTSDAELCHHADMIEGRFRP